MPIYFKQDRRAAEDFSKLAAKHLVYFGVVLFDSIVAAIDV